MITSQQFVTKWYQKYQAISTETPSSLYNDLKILKRTICDGSSSLAGNENSVCEALNSLILRQIKESRLAIECLGALFARHASKLSFTVSRSSFLCLKTKLIELVQALKEGRSTHHWISTLFRAFLCILKAKKVVSLDDQHTQLDIESLTTLTDSLHYCLFTHASNPWLSAMTFKVPSTPSYFTLTSDTPSESETSFDKELTPLHRSRLDALRLLEQLASQVGVHLLPFWNKFLGSSPSSCLFKCMRMDPSLKIKVAASQCILSMIHGAEKTLENTPLSLSSSSTTPLPPLVSSESKFTSLAEKLQYWLKYLHHHSIHPLQEEIQNRIQGNTKSATEIIQFIKISTSSAVAFKYEARPNKLKELVSVLTNLAMSSLDDVILSECFSSLSILHESGCQFHEFFSILIPLIQKHIHLFCSWILLSHLMSVRNQEALLNYVPLLYSMALFEPSKDPEVIEAQCKYIERSCALFPDTFLTVHSIPNFMDQWMVSRLQSYETDPCLPCEIACACSSIASFTSHLFEQLDSRRQIFFMTALLHHASSSHVLIKGAACRALGVLATFSCLHEDSQFLLDTTTALLKASEDPHLQVKSKVAWSLTQVLCLYEQRSLMFEPALLDQVLNQSLIFVQEPDVCKVHALRLLAILYPVALQHHQEELVHSWVLKTMTKGAFKTRWNACRTAGCILQVHEVPSLIQALIQLLQQAKNFKILIHATKALQFVTSSPYSRRIMEHLHSLFSKYQHDTSVYQPELMKAIEATRQVLTSASNQ